MSGTIQHEEYLQKLMLLAERGTFPHAVIIVDANCDKALENILFLAKFMICDSKNEKPCEKCSGCIKINSGSHTDVKILKPTKDFASIKIEEIRKIREDAHIVSLEGHQKFYIIENAELMTTGAQNAFIKILEEPPKNVIFVLVCKTVSALLPTVRSRCQIYSCENTLDVSESNEELIELAKSIAKSSLSGDIESVMRFVAETPNDRNYLKSLTEMILHKLICESAKQNFCKKTINMIDELHGVMKIFDNNININLIKCRIMAALTE